MYLRYTDFEEKLSRVPGLYSWHIKPSDNSFDQIEKCFKAYHATSYEALITGDFDFSFGGEITSNEKSGIEDLKTSSIDEDLLTITSFFLNTPLYIGISKGDLHRRLTDHKSAFEKFNRIEVKHLPAIHINDEDRDKQSESDYFGSRLARLVKSKGLTTNNLFVKVFAYNSKFDEDQDSREHQIKRLLQLEKMMNKTLKPILGRR